MPTYSTIVKTANGRKYLQQLCKHFAHKVTVRYSSEEGRVAFPPGRCVMRADDETLIFSFEARDTQGVPVIKYIIDDHLTRFAWREELEYAWMEGAPDTDKQILVAEDFLPDDAGGAREDMA